MKLPVTSSFPARTISSNKQQVGHKTRSLVEFPGCSLAVLYCNVKFNSSSSL